MANATREHATVSAIEFFIGFEYLIEAAGLFVSCYQVRHGQNSDTRLRDFPQSEPWRLTNNWFGKLESFEEIVRAMRLFVSLLQTSDVPIAQWLSILPQIIIGSR